MKPYIFCDDNNAPRIEWIHNDCRFILDFDNEEPCWIFVSKYDHMEHGDLTEEILDIFKGIQPRADVR